MNIIAPWDDPEYVEGYNRCLQLLETLDPVVTVVDPLFSQGFDACRQTSRKHIILNPTSLKEIVLTEQPR